MSLPSYVGCAQVGECQKISPISHSICQSMLISLLTQMYKAVGVFGYTPFFVFFFLIYVLVLLLLLVERLGLLVVVAILRRVCPGRRVSKNIAYKSLNLSEYAHFFTYANVQSSRCLWLSFFSTTFYYLLSLGLCLFFAYKSSTEYALVFYYLFLFPIGCLLLFYLKVSR